MFVRFVIRETVWQNKTGPRKTSKRCGIFVCDTCSDQFEKTANLSKLEKARNHFCSMKCAGIARRKGGKTNKFIQEQCKKRFGVCHPLKSEHVLAKVKKTCKQRYGVENAAQSNEAKSSYKKTMLERYGVEHNFQLEHVRIACNSPTSRKRAHETMKRNGSYARSIIEDKYYDWLCEAFGKEGIDRHVQVNGWIIDFYVKLWDCYVQFDGVYWHGLNRSIEDIKRFESDRDKVILETWKRDRRQDDWFLKNSLQLARVTDAEFEQYLRRL